MQKQKQNYATVFDSFSNIFTKTKWVREQYEPDTGNIVYDIDRLRKTHKISMNAITR